MRETKGFPKVVCLCGSTRFKDAFLKAQRDLTLQGEIVLSVGLFGHVEGLDMDGETKRMLDELHKRKIDLADYVYVLNVDFYVGDSTRSEIEYAKAHGKPVRYLNAEPVPRYHHSRESSQPCPCGLCQGGPDAD